MGPSILGAYLSEKPDSLAREMLWGQIHFASRFVSLIKDQINIDMKEEYGIQTGNRLIQTSQGRSHRSIEGLPESVKKWISFPHSVSLILLSNRYVVSLERLTIRRPVAVFRCKKIKESQPSHVPAGH